MFTGLPETVLAGVAGCQGVATAASGPQALKAVMTNLALEPLPPLQPLFLRSDANDDGTADISDPVWLLNYLFLGTKQPPAPFGMCGEDTPGDELDCKIFSGCP